MRVGLALMGVVLAVGAATAQAPVVRQARDLSGAMVATVEQRWPAGVIDTQARPGAWAYEVGTLLDGMMAQYEVTHDPKTLAYVRATVDRWVQPDGSIQVQPGKPFDPSLHTLDNLEPGRAVLALYRATKEPRYATAAKFIFEQFATMPRNSAGGYWHKQIYPNQMWLDGAYMAEPFRAAYAKEFGVTGEFDDTAKQLLLMDEHMRDPKTGLLRHGWDASKTEQWADKSTGLSQEIWARAMGWYAVALVDTLPSFPDGHPDRAKLIATLRHVAEGVAQYQDSATGLWWDVLDKGGAPGNFREQSASAMFVYALAKGARLGYIDRKYRAVAERGFRGISSTFVTREGERVTLHGTVKVSGLGGKPYRSGTYDYYVHEPVGDDDAKGVGVFLLAASEIARGK